MSSTVGCEGNTRTSHSRDMPTTRSVIAKARHRRLSCVKRWNRGLRNAGYNCTGKRPRSSTARTQIVRGSIPSDRSTFLVTHSDQERLSIAQANASSHSFQQSARRPPRKCGVAFDAGDCIVRKVLEQLSEGTGESIPLVCQDWANTKAAYRFFSNERVNEEDISAGHFQATRERFAAVTDETVLILHDTTEFSYHREHVQAIGIIHKAAVGRIGDNRPRHYTVCGIQ